MEGGVVFEAMQNPQDRLNTGKMEHGCAHYRRRCRIWAPCCIEIYACKQCHNESMSHLKDPLLHHELPRYKFEWVICSLYDTEKNVKQICENCGVKMGDYFYSTCKLFDDDISKKQYHCDDCGICKVGGQDNFFPLLEMWLFLYG